MLELFDTNFIGWNKDEIYNYGTSANKIFEYMYSAKPIINSYSGGYDIVKEVGCGISVEAENSVQIADAILKLYKMSDVERRKMGENGRKYVLENFTYEKLAEKYEELF